MFECLTSTLARKLDEVANDGKWAGVRFARQNFVFGTVVKYAGWSRADLLRISEQFAGTGLGLQQRKHKLRSPVTS